MAASLKASAAGLQQVDQARRRKGWNEYEPAWYELVPTSRATLKRFWQQEPIHQEVFVGICQAVGLEDWSTIAETAPTPALPLVSVPCFSTYDEATWVGREALTQTLINRLQHQCRVSMLLGIPGIGKTALAERLVAAAIAANWRSPFQFCSLSLDEVQSPSFAAGARQLLEKLRITIPKEQIHDANALKQRLVQILKTQPCWLQLDSLEQLLTVDEAGEHRFVDATWLDFFRQLLMPDCQSWCVLTSQDLPVDLKALGSRYARFWDCYTLHGLTEAERLNLFQKKGLAGDSETIADLKRMGRAYEGHPLVLQVVAGEILADFEGEVSRYWQRFQTEFEQVEISPALRSRELKYAVRQRVKQALQRLPIAAQSLLCASSVYRRPVPISFCLALLDASDVITEDSAFSLHARLDRDTANQQSAFNVLQDRYLIEWDNQLIRLHNLVRSVAYELLRTDLAVWQTTERAAARLWQTAYHPAADAPPLEQVRGDLEAFHHFCNTQDWDAAQHILFTPINSENNSQDSSDYSAPLHQQLQIWGYSLELILLYQQLLHQIDLQIDIRCLNGLGFIQYRLSHFEQAIVYHQQALTLARQLGDC